MSLDLVQSAQPFGEVARVPVRPEEPEALRALFVHELAQGLEGRLGARDHALELSTWRPRSPLRAPRPPGYGSSVNEPFPFDALIFDLDGTLLATDRYWIPAARAGARRAFAELGIERAEPSDADWMSLVGLPLAQGFDLLFADLSPAERTLVRERCVEEEHFALDAGKGALLPGVREALEELRARRVALGIASNCSQPYLDAALGKLGLAEFVREGRCLDTPGIATKADMVRDLLCTFGTRSAVMVGDRAGDRDAAHANAIPHVHLRSGFAPPGEHVECEAVIEDLRALLPRLWRRGTWILDALEQLGCLGPAPPRRIALTGLPAAGKTLFARDALRLLRARDIESVALEQVDRLDSLESYDRRIHLLIPTAQSLARLRALGPERESSGRAVLELHRDLEERAVRENMIVLNASNPLGPP